MIWVKRRIARLWVLRFLCGYTLTHRGSQRDKPSRLHMYTWNESSNREHAPPDTSKSRSGSVSPDHKFPPIWSRIITTRDSIIPSKSSSQEESADHALHEGDEKKKGIWGEGTCRKANTWSPQKRKLFLHPKSLRACPCYTLLRLPRFSSSLVTSFDSISELIR